jgi:hypothetical protein
MRGKTAHRPALSAQVPRQVVSPNRQGCLFKERVSVRLNGSATCAGRNGPRKIVFSHRVAAASFVSSAQGLSCVWNWRRLRWPRKRGCPPATPDDAGPTHSAALIAASAAGWFIPNRAEWRPSCVRARLQRSHRPPHPPLLTFRRGQVALPVVRPPQQLLCSARRRPPELLLCSTRRCIARC